MTIQRYIPTNALPIDEPGLGTVYVYPTGTGKYGAIGYKPKANNKAFHYTFRTDAQLDKYIADWFDGLRRHRQMLAERKALTSQPHTLKVGDVLHHSWGYDQTQCDFYQIVATTAKGATVRAIASETVEGSEGFMSDRRVALKDHFCGAAERIVIDGQNRPGGKLFRHGSASLWDGTSQYCSWYA